MKKGLSILLILAACFGFYGSAVSLNDVLACKDYWEEEGEKTTADLNKLEDGLDELQENTEAYLDGIEQVKQGEADLVAGEKEYNKGLADYEAAPAKLEAGRKQVKDGEKALNSLKTLINGLKQVTAGYKKDFVPGVDKLRAGKTLIANDVATAAKSGDLDLASLATLVGVQPADVQALLAGLTNTSSTDAAYNEVVKKAVASFNKAGDALAGYSKKAGTASAGLGQLSDGLKQAIGTPAEGATLKQIQSEIGNMKTGILKLVGAFAKDNAATVEKLFGGIATAMDGKTAVQYIAQLKGVVDAVQTGIKDKTAEMNGYADKIGAYTTGYNKLISGQKQLAGGLQQCLAGMLGNSDMNAALKQIAGDKYAMIQALATDKSPLFAADFDTFKTYMSQIVPMIEVKALPTLNKTKDDGQKTLDAGKKKLAAGLADYKAAPAKLADGRAQLEKGRQDLADGKAQLAEYEDGVQQIRDGLKTLMETEANGGLTPIAERIGVDEDFNMEDGSLNFDAAHMGVEKGREYQGDSGELITKELTQRATGFGIGIGGGVLAVLAAILAFLKKNKVAGVLGILGAAAAGVGIFIANSAGLEFSAIAGSALGATPMVALGALAVVALIASIAFFKAPKTE